MILMKWIDDKLCDGEGNERINEAIYKFKLKSYDNLNLYFNSYVHFLKKKIDYVSLN